MNTPSSLALIAAMIVLSACSTFQLGPRSDPLTAEQHFQLGASYRTQGPAEAAGPQYEAALRLDKGYIPALVAAGNLAFESGDLKKAAAFYRRVLRLDRTHAGANNNLAMVLLTRGKGLDKAERYAQTALRQGGPLRPYVLDTLASIYARQGRVAEAREALDEADAAAPAGDTGLRGQLAETRKNLEAGVRPRQGKTL